MKEWRIPVTWEECSVVKVEANTLKEAMEIAYDEKGEIPLPSDGNYVDGSWSLTESDTEIVRELFELEVPEIEDGIVEIKSISREAGFRTKIAVWSNDPEVDSVGACIGPRGSRIQTIVSELKNEKIDIVRWSPDPVEYIVNAISPARVVSVDIMTDDDETKDALVVVPDDQLSLAIGREGQNVRLAHRLTGWKIDIKSESQIREIILKAQAEMEAEESEEEVQ